MRPWRCGVLFATCFSCCLGRWSSENREVRAVASECLQRLSGQVLEDAGTTLAGEAFGLAAHGTSEVHTTGCLAMRIVPKLALVRFSQLEVGCYCKVAAEPHELAVVSGIGAWDINDSSMCSGCHRPGSGQLCPRR